MPLGFNATVGAARQLIQGAQRVILKSAQPGYFLMKEAYFPFFFILSWVTYSNMIRMHNGNPPPLSPSLLFSPQCGNGK